MGQLIVLGFDSAAEAQDVRKELVALQQDHLIALEDAVVVECNSEGKVELHQALNLTTAGPGSGASRATDRRRSAQPRGVLRMAGARGAAGAAAD